MADEAKSNRRFGIFTMGAVFVLYLLLDLIQEYVLGLRLENNALILAAGVKGGIAGGIAVWLAKLFDFLPKTGERAPDPGQPRVKGDRNESK